LFSQSSPVRPSPESHGSDTLGPVTTPDPRKESRALIASIKPADGEPVLGPVHVRPQPGVFFTQDGTPARTDLIESTTDLPPTANLDDVSADAARVTYLFDEVAKTEPVDLTEFALAARNTGAAVDRQRRSTLALVAHFRTSSSAQQSLVPHEVPRPARVPSRRVRRKMHFLAGRTGLTPVAIRRHFADRGRSYSLDVICWVLQQRGLA
jgi:hypothetical protein